MSLLLLFSGLESGQLPAANLTVTVNGIDRTEFVDGERGIRWEDVLNGRGQLSLTFSDVVGGFEPEDGSEVIVWEDGIQRFAGTLIEPVASASPGAERLFWECEVVEYSAICDRILVARAYTDQTLQEIVLDIVSQDLSLEGIGTAGVETGPTIKKAVFNWITVTDAFNQLAELTGMSWWIDPFKVLQFRSRLSIAAPVTLTNENTANGTLRIRPDRQNYRNTQVMRFGGGLTDLRTEAFVGDGERRTFSLAFKAGTEPTIEVNDVAKTVGIRGVETLKDWYWNKGVTEISQDDGASPLTSSDTLEVTYQGLFPGIILAGNGAEIASRMAIEGGSGKYMRVEERANVESVDAALVVVQAMLDRNSTISRVITCQTLEPGWAPGQLAPCQFVAHGIDDEFLIESVVAEVNPGLPIVYTLTMRSADTYGGWQEYFRKLQRIGRQFVISENEVVIGLTQLVDSATASDSLSSTDAAPEARIGTARVGYSAVRAA
jgi:hypothetical protein